MNSIDQHTEAAAVAKIAQDALKPTQLLLGSAFTPAFAAGPNTQLVSLERLQDAPLRARGTQALATLKDLHQFLSKQTQNAELNPVVFANRENLSFVAVLNYHQATKPQWMDLRAQVILKLSRQLKVWQEEDETRLSQEQFAMFLEENIEDIREPNGAEVLTFAQTLEMTRTETFKSSITTTTGEVNLAYSNERSGDGQAKLITDIKLGIPLFERGEAYQIPVKIYHRVSEGKLTFWFKLLNLDYIIDRAWTSDMDFLRDTIAEFATVYEGVAPAESSPIPLK